MTRLTHISLGILILMPIPYASAGCEDGFRPPLGVPRGETTGKDDSTAPAQPDSPERQKASRRVFSLEEFEGLASRSPDKAETLEDKPAPRKKKNRKKKRKRSNKKAESEKEIRERREENLRVAKERTDEIRAYLTGSPRERTIISDVLAAYWLKNQSANNTVTLLLGNHHDVPSKDIIMQVRSLTRSLVEAGKRIIFDADSQLAPVIAEAGGERALGLRAQLSTSIPAFGGKTPVITIHNPYLRMRALKENSEHVVTDVTSVSGAGLMVERDVTHVLDLGKEWQWDLARWKTGRNFSTYVKAVTTIEALVDALRADMHTPFGFKRYFVDAPAPDASTPPPAKVTLAPPFPRYSADKFLEEAVQEANSYRLKQVLQIATALLEGQRLMEHDPSTGTKIPGGAVIFGSSSVIYSYKDLVYDTAWILGELGVPVATGGAGGFMEVANRGAYDAGGHSIGVPIGGTFLKNERKVMSDYHTLTVTSSGYESRIPLLLHRRQLVVVAPGSSGTLKELATTLVALAGQAEGTEEIVFLSSEYYGELHRWLHWLKIPEHLKARIKIIDTAEEIIELVENLQAELGHDYSKLMTAEKPSPRKKKEAEEEEERPDEEDQTQDPIELPFEERWKDWLD